MGQSAMDSDGRSFYQDRNDVTVTTMQDVVDRINSLEEAINYYKCSHSEEGYLHATRGMRAELVTLLVAVDEAEEIEEEETQYNELCNETLYYNDVYNRTIRTIARCKLEYNRNKLYKRIVGINM